MENIFGIITAYAEPAASQGGQQAGGVEALIGTFFPLILMIAVFYFLIMRPQKKREKQFKQMLAELKAGDTVIMSCGIEGRVLTVKEEDITIETGADRVKLTFKKWSVKEVTTIKA